MGNLPQALELGLQGKVSVDIASSIVNQKLFGVRVCFQATLPVLNRQNVVESDRIPFAVFLEKTNGNDQFKLCATVGTKEYGWTGLDTEFETTLTLGNWYVADVLFNVDTVALFINGKPAGVRSLPKGTLMALPGSSVFIGTWIDGKRNPFPGKIAGLQLHYKILPELLGRAEDARRQPGWFMSHKQLTLEASSLGAPVGAIKFSAGSSSYQQSFQSGQLQYHNSLGVAFALRGAINQYYQQLSQLDQQELGFLVSDEVGSANGVGRKSLFQKGAIYWSSSTGPVRVVGQMFLDYEGLGESAYLGFPKTKASAISGGLEQNFEGGRMYYRTGAARSFEVHGAILARYILIGGPAKLGFPVSNELDVIKDGKVVGKASQFEYGVMYWSSYTGAFEVYGDIRTKYEELNGPLGALGFPTSGETDIPGGGGRYNTFQNGSIVWFGSAADMQVCLPFRIRLGRIDSVESEDFGMGQNDLAIDAYIDGLPGGNHHVRFPISGDLGDHNIVDIDHTFTPLLVPNNPSLSITFKADVWDIDPGRNDLIGNYRHSLSIANAWGFRENGGIFNESIQKIRHITWALWPDVNPATLTTGQRWWGMNNPGISPITYPQYASAFNDVDSEREWYDATDWLDKAFYELVVKDLAKNGRCMGMCIEALLSWKRNSLFSLPIDRFTNTNVTGNEFAIKHQRQVGAPAVWWFAGQVLSGNTHDPVAVFEQSQFAYSIGQHPVLCLAQNYDFSGAPHVVLPHAWEKKGNNWRIHIFDPNFPTKEGNNPTRFIEINASSNTFSYVGGSSYSGAAWSGGRLYYFPWITLADRPRTPIWEAIMLLVSGTMVILGDDAQTESLTDTTGTNLDYFHPDVTNLLKAGQPVRRRFVSYKGFDRAQPAQLLLRQGLDNGPKSIIKKANTDVVNSDFIHTIRGSKNGQFQYALKSLLTEVKMVSAINASEKHSVAVNNLQRPDHTMSLGVGSNKTVALEIVNKLGTGRDHMRLVIDQLPVTSAKAMNLCIHPGLGGLDILPSQDAIKTTLTVESVINGSKQIRKFPLALEGGARILHSTVATQGELLIGQLDALHSSVQDFKLVSST
jgi:hypothetical protein